MKYMVAHGLRLNLINNVCSGSTSITVPDHINLCIVKLSCKSLKAVALLRKIICPSFVSYVVNKYNNLICTFKNAIYINSLLDTYRALVFSSGDVIKMVSS